MANDRMEENWARVKRQIEGIWGNEFDEKELKKARGNLNKMVTLIADKTGEDQGDIMQKMVAII